jgi:oxygen-dependent protoporphyrinogen oxidase
MEAKHGSLGRAMLAARKAMRVSKAPARPLFSSLRDGMQRLVDVILTRLDPATLQTRTLVSNLERTAKGWNVTANASANSFDAVILAIPANTTGSLLARACPRAAEELRAIQYSSSITASLIYDEKVVASLPPGFGFLVPRTERRRMLACTFVHNKFPHRAPPDRAIVRCFLGGSRDEAVLSLSESEILEVLRCELKEILGLAADPLAVRIYKWPQAMAQYGVGHLERLDRIAQAVKEVPGLALAGNGYRGIGVPDCVRSGREAAAQMLTSIGLAGRSAS